MIILSGRDCRRFRQMTGKIIANYFYYILQGNKSDKERIIVRNELIKDNQGEPAGTIGNHRETTWKPWRTTWKPSESP